VPCSSYSARRDFNELPRFSRSAVASHAGGGCDTCGVEQREREAHLDGVLIGSREQREIVIAEYDPAWPRRFVLERARIGAALGAVARRIEHIGSTAVPGLAAKPDYAEAKSSLVQEILARAGTPRTSSRGLIRPVRMTDATAIAALLGELGYPAEADDVVARLERVLGRDSGILVYDLEREAVGLVTYQLIHLLYRSLPQCRITALVVREDRRRRGIARALLRAVESLARERGCFRLEVTTRPDRGDALGLYIASGFCERPRRLVKRLDDG
jgi:ribosomal protein S18 acetylase RimI-like enzyme